jgi:hypothetical protein
MKTKAEVTIKDLPNPASIVRGWAFLFREGAMRVGPTKEIVMINSTLIRQSNYWGVLLLAFLTILLLPHISYAQLPGPDLSVTVSPASGAPGSQVSVSVIGDFTQSVNAIEFTLSYDSSVLSLASAGTCWPAAQCSQFTPSTSVTAGGGNGSWIVVNNNTTSGATGTLKVGMFNNPGAGGALLTAVCNTGAASTCSGQQIAVITFNVLSTATNSPISLGLGNANFYSTVISSTSCTSNATCPTSPANEACNKNNLCEYEVKTPVSTLTAGTFTLSGSGSPSIPGDVLGQGSVTAGDVLAVRQAWAQFAVGGQAAITVPNFNMANALVNGASTFQYGDVMMISQYHAGVQGIVLQ